MSIKINTGVPIKIIAKANQAKASGLLFVDNPKMANKTTGNPIIIASSHRRTRNVVLDIGALMGSGMEQLKQVLNARFAIDGA